MPHFKIQEDRDKQKIIDLYNKNYSYRQIAQEFNVHLDTIFKWVNKWGIKTKSLSERHQTISFDKEYFKEINTEEKAYFLGFIAADGCVCKNAVSLCLHRQDEHILKKLKKELKSGHALMIDREKYRKFSICNIEFAESLRQKGIMDRKTFLIKFPSEDIVPKELLVHYMRGYFDGDGCISFSKNKKGIRKILWKTQITSNFDFLSKYSEVLNEMLGNVSKSKLRREKRRQSPIFYYEIGGTSPITLQKIYNLLYKDATIFLTRKKEKFETIIRIFNEPFHPTV